MFLIEMGTNIIYANKVLGEYEPIERTNNKDIIENYLTDESSLFRGKADEVMFPKNELQIAQILKEANNKKVLVTISGAGTGLTGARIPLGGIVLSTEKLTRLTGRGLREREKLIEYTEMGKKYEIYVGKDSEKGEFYAVCPAGIPGEILNNMIAGEGLYYPPLPTELTAFIGGTVATNASGARTFHYGTTRDYIRRLRVVLPNGDILDVKRGQVKADEKGTFQIIFTSGEEITVELPKIRMPNVKKNSAGYYVKPEMDLIDLFIGSEGTLGVISEVEVRLVTKPAIVVPIFAHFEEEEKALEFVKKLREESKELNILSIEYFDINSVKIIKRKYSSPIIPDKSNYIVFFEQKLSSEKEMCFLEKVYGLLNEYSNLDATASLDPDWIKQSKEIRHYMPEQVTGFFRSHRLPKPKLSTDIAVPAESFDKMMNHYHEVTEEVGVPYVLYGHIGDYHLHLNFLPTNEQQVKDSMEACIRLCREAVKLGGTVTAEHGVGKKTYTENGKVKPLIELMYGEKGVIEMAKMKHTFDPNHILNIGNILTAEILEIVK